MSLQLLVYQTVSTLIEKKKTIYLHTHTYLPNTCISFSVCSGILCGQTGSYIFSQTIFTMRAGLKTRWAGIFLIFTELAVFLATTSVLEVTPLFYLGGMLTFIGFDLLYEWLVEVRHKLLLSEYVIVLCTFIAIFIFGINGGILVGIIHSALGELKYQACNFFSEVYT